MSNIKFLEELPRPNRMSKFSKYFEALRDNPGMWAEYPTKFKNPNSARSARTTIKNAEMREVKYPGEFDSAVRNGVLYVRYVGEV